MLRVFKPTAGPRWPATCDHQKYLQGGRVICSDSRTSMVSQKMQYHSKLEPSSTCSKNRLYCDLTKILTGALSSTWNKPTDQTRINLSNIFIEKVLSTEFPFMMPIVLCARLVHRRKSLKTMTYCCLKAMER